ncbi:VirB4 family type IV secretion/conjugal transfer ATPase [Rickettsiella endosymbiont of Dermanyssus gallinae]|uniref:VirB4 family type IV secretion/conjugal transfer ATPase n=1 Tax=Rickettsiella endosymbiont of Dermanyssus gallinae TaxID=2856608 RepID=UPI001C531EE7|nr:VirB4 family type IV secretion/conjugal transfer ATPase [Rickettsiella endosymbiont of Dermanyssus gallinae]
MLSKIRKLGHNPSNRRLRNEANASRHINIIGHYNDDTLIDKSGKLIQIIQLSGIDGLTHSEATLDAYKNRRNSLLKSFSSEYAIYFWTVCRQTIAFPAGEFQSGFAQQLNEKYRQKIQQRPMFQNDMYIGIVTKPAEGILNQSFNWFKKLNHQADKFAQQQQLLKTYEALVAVTQKVLQTLSDYQPKLLGVYQNNGITFSAPLTFIDQLINGDKLSIPLLKQDACTYLPRKRLFFNRHTGTIEYRTSDQLKQFAAVISIKAYPAMTYQGLLDGLNSLRMEYTLTQSFRFYDRYLAKARLRDQQHDMQQTKEESVRQTEQIDESFDDTASGEVNYGKHHFSLVCYAETLEQLNQHVGEIIALLSDRDIVCVREDVGCECGFWAQLPGNFGYIVREADISTKNIAAFASLHDSPSGQREHNFWGNAVTVLETLSGSPYYFNFHDRDVGNFMVVGATGSGKTVLVGFLIAQSMKFGGKRVIFDKDRGLEILVRALSGTYEVLKPSIATGFNPCQLADTSENRTFLLQLFKQLLKYPTKPLDESDIKVIEETITGLYRLDPSERQFCHIAPFFGKNSKGSLRARFESWHSDRENSWLFDNQQDCFEQQRYESDVIGLDLSHILKDESCKTPTLMYLLHRFSQQLEGQRGLIFLDEAWLALQDDYFKNIINDLSRTPRKKNNCFGLATQAAFDTTSSANQAAINEAAACKIFFPNPMADRKTYIEHFGLSDREFELIKTLPNDSHYFLLNYGRGKTSVVLRANLQHMDDEIAIISGRTETIALLDIIRAEVGNDPNIWLPIFHQRRKSHAG